jgi:hypothetical protein
MRSDGAMIWALMVLVPCLRQLCSKLLGYVGGDGEFKSRTVWKPMTCSSWRANHWMRCTLIVFFFIREETSCLVAQGSSLREQESRFNQAFFLAEDLVLLHDVVR